MKKLLYIIVILFCVVEARPSDTLFPKYKNFVANRKALGELKNYQIVGVIIDEKNDSLEFVIHRILPDTLRLQIRFGEQYAITVINSNTGWIVDPTRKIYQPQELHPEEVSRIKFNILYLFGFFDENLFEPVSTEDWANPDTSFVSFVAVNSNKDTTFYNFGKVNFSDIYKIVKFYHSPYTFKIIPKYFFNFKGFVIPRVIEVVSNNTKKTLLYIVNININTDIDRNLFFFKKWIFIFVIYC